MLEKRLTAIEERNRKVEADKAWETSLFRRAALAFLTYAIVVLFLVHIEAQRPFLSALIPVFGYLISTLTLPFLRRFWQRRFYEN